MPKHEFLTPKAIANRIKAKGLQKLRWYCQMCQKQCRDENGFKCHTMSESHQRQLLLFAENPDKYIDSFSKEFEESFLELLSRRFGTKRVHANQVYQEYITDRNHLHMNATMWETLTEFVKYLGRAGKCIVDQTEKGWFITYVDRDPEAIRRQEHLAKKEKLELDDEEKMAQFIQKQVERAKETVKEQPEPVFTELKRENEEEKFTINLTVTKKKEVTPTPAKISPAKNPLSLLKKKETFRDDISVTSASSSKIGDKRKCALEEIMEEEERQKEKLQRKNYWLAKMYDTEKLILVVESKPCIWDIKDRAYSDKNAKRKAWEEVAQAMNPGLTGPVSATLLKMAQERWKNTRDNFMRTAKRMREQKSGAPATNQRPYIYFDIMSFLLPSIQPRRTENNVPLEVDEHAEGSQEGSQDISMDGESNLQEFPDTSQSSVIRQLKRKRDTFQETEAYIDSRLDISDVDGDRLFLLSLLPALKKGIIVKVITKKLGDKYYKKKAVVKDVQDLFAGIIKMLDTNDVLKLDQAHLETVIPAQGKSVLVVNGAYRGCEAILMSLNEENFSVKIKINSGLTKGRIIAGVKYEDVCKIHIPS